MPEPLFILAPPRSFTSVVGGMIGQHPQAYGLPEVNLSHGDTLGELFGDLTANRQYGTAGLLRVLAQINDNVQTEEAVIRAKQWVNRRSHWSAAKVFAYIQEAVGPVMMVDKSPRNTLKIEHLNRLKAIFPRASFLHLVRHPRTTGKSTLELVNTYIAPQMEGRSGKFEPTQIWQRSHQHILNFCAELPVGQWMRIKGETLLADPKFYLAQICEWLDISSDAASIEAMLHPETSPYACMGPESAPSGNDPNWLKNPALDLDRLARITEPSLHDELEWRPGEHFNKPVLKLARQFGYG